MADEQRQGGPFEQVLAIWRGLDPRRRVLMALAGAATIAAVALLTAFGSRVEYRLLYAGLEPQEAGQVLEKLKEMKVDAQVEGEQILVAADRVHEARLELAAAGLPKGGGEGFELFDRQSFGMSDFAEQVTFLRSLQGELSRTIRSLEPVEKAAVHIVRPKPSVFRSERRPGSASVVLHLRPGRALTGQQISGVTHLVASAVDGVEVDRVSVVDQHGNVLTRPHRDEDSRLTDTQLEAQARVELDLARKAQSMLDAAFGVGKAFVRVTARLDRTTSQETRESYDPDGQVARTERITSRDRTRGARPAGGGGQGAGAGAGGGAAGTGGNVGDAGGASGASYGGAGEREVEETTETTYEVGKRVEVRAKQAGAVERLTVALLIDESLTGEAPELERVVKQATGFDEERGDAFELATVAFVAKEDESLSAEMDAFERRRFITDLARHGAAAFVALAIAVVLGRIVLRAMPKAQKGQRQGPDAALGARLDALVDDTPKESPSERALRLRRELAQAVTASPRAGADLVLEWLEAQAKEEGR